MPKVTMFYGKGSVSTKNLLTIGRQVKKILARRVEMTEADIDWVVQQYGAGSLAPLSIEIETIGKPERKEKLSKSAIYALRAEIQAIEGFPKVNPNDLLIWVKFQDPDGVHV